jgi:small subunit ribosomal protein S20
MAHHKSAWKRHLQSRKRRTANRQVKATFKTQLKKAHAEIEGGNADGNAGEVQKAVALLARAGRKRVLHPKAAARRVSRLMKAANKSKS